MASGGTAAGAAAAFNADVNNRQLHPSERQLAKELARKSGGKYTVEQIEEQMRLMGYRVQDEQPNTTAVLVGDEQIKDSGMPFVSDGIAIVEAPGRASMEMQQFIITNSLDGASFIPGQSPYVASNPALNKPVLTTGASQNNLPTARCANGDLACLSGVGAQQSSVPELTQAAREAIADTAASTSRQAGVVASGATAVAAASSPPIKPIAGAVAVGATAIGIAADAVEQVMRPDVGQVSVDLGGSAIGIAIDAVPSGKLIAPITNEAIETLKNSQIGNKIRDGVNQLLTEELEK